MNIPLTIQRIVIKQRTIELFVPDDSDIKQAYASGKIAFPYWSQVWPSAMALSEFIISNQQLIQHKNLVEFGAGLGLPSLVAASYARTVLCSDKDPQAVEMTKSSAQLNKIDNLQAVVLDWSTIPLDVNADVVLLSDVNYEPGEFVKLQELILHFLRKGTTVLLATPQRLTAKAFLLPLLQFISMQQELTINHYNENIPVSVLVLE